MADGEGKDIFSVLMGMNAQMNRVEAKLDGLVSHERMAEVVNTCRQEWRGDFREGQREARSERAADIQKAVNDVEARLRTEIRQANVEQDKRMADREMLIETTAKSVRLQFLGIIGMALTGFAYALYQLVIRGG